MNLFTYPGLMIPKLIVSVENQTFFSPVTPRSIVELLIEEGTLEE